jgi:hypothetical protein
VTNRYIYRSLTQRFPPTYSERAAHVLQLDYKGFQDKVSKGELEDKIATGVMGFRDEDPNMVF